MKTFQFEPKPDITAYELALIIKHTHGYEGTFEVTNEKNWADLWEPEAKRHFKEIESIYK